MDSLKFDAYGWLKLELVVDGNTVSREIDLIDFYNRAVAAGAEHADAGRHGEAHKARTDFFNAELGTKLSVTDGFRLFNMLFAKVLDLKKKDLSNGTVGTPSSTASRPGATDTPPASFGGV